MIELDDPIWDTLQGGYRSPYNPVSALRRLQAAKTAEEQKKVYAELWNELHHQGDLGICSYACIPQLVRIAQCSPPMTYDLFAMIAVIETERHENGNPRIPGYLRDDYATALSAIPQLIAIASPPKWDESCIKAACAALAASKGNRILARAYLEMNQDSAIAFLREETGYEP